MSEHQTGAVDAAPAEQAAAPGTATETQQSQEQGDPVAQRLDELSGQMQQFAQQWQTLQPLVEQAQQPDPYAAEPRFDPYTGQPVDDPSLQVDWTDPSSINQYMQSQIKEGVQQAVQPIQSQLYQQEVQKLEGQFPDIFKPEVVEPVSQLLAGAGYDPQQNPPPPAAIAMAYKAWKADQIAQGQTPLSQAGQGAVLETGAGASPQQPDVDPAEQLLGPRRGPAQNVFGI